MAIFFSSDFHFNHRNICRGTSSWDNKSGTRPFDSLNEMNGTILDNLNSAIGENDELYYLGDFIFGDVTLTRVFRDKIRCKNIYFINGNHDKHIYQYRDCFAWIKDYFMVKHKGKNIAAFHYPIASWDRQHHGAFHAFGHCHGSFTGPNGKSHDVGVDTNEFKPYSFDEFVEICDAKKVNIVDNHV
jgi:calcineurin-like phosphoesterase family protein